MPMQKSSASSKDARVETLTAASEATQIGATALLGQLQSIVHHLGWEWGRLELVTHAILVHALHHIAALPGGCRRASSLNGREAWVQCVGVANSSSARLPYHGQHHQQADAHESCCYNLWPCHGCGGGQHSALESWLRKLNKKTQHDWAEDDFGEYTGVLYSGLPSRKFSTEAHWQSASKFPWQAAASTQRLSSYLVDFGNSNFVRLNQLES